MRNVVVAGTPCGATDVLARPGLGPQGEPTAASTALIDRADRRFATGHDLHGRPRGERADIGAYEFAG